MFMKEDHTFQEIREKSVQQWLEGMSTHEDLEVRGGVRATTGYIESLKQRIDQLEKMNDVKDTYLKKIKMKDTRSE